MTSINTNNSAMAALQTLRNVNSNLSSTQSAVSSGLRVGKASDNAAYWSIATTMKSDNSALSAVSDALGMGAAKVDTAYTAVQSSIDVVSEIKAKLVAATEDGVDKGKINDEITQLQKQLTSIASSASFNGENWVSSTSGSGKTMSVVSSFIRDSSGGVSVSTSGYTSTATDMLFTGTAADGILDRTTGTSGKAISTFTIGSTTSKGDIDKLITDTESALKDMTSLGSKLGSLQKGIDLQSDFVSKLSDSIDSGVGRLVDADMEEESSKLSALQTQQQLAIQSLSIANSSSQNILSLFR
ncbi:MULTISPECIES: flagellin N-terminal helical domain-containing protein [unclassified Rhizobium]|uniref:flagellin N-terminal helical domain-containing protein n=1 Tax=unclassified Rhizobium TaxID=2613769 RepID=UPI001AD98315|nr:MULTISPECIES: flagellin [unclassified Rhizobium]MBO9122697.1 flagellin [Rhizobium sp. 16-488-2b]MBO9173229.1 flagellin [Rhizobium sp. 16-488-2a]